jgi:Polyketide cyclase / dehydrase and lipid transport
MTALHKSRLSSGRRRPFPHDRSKNSNIIFIGSWTAAVVLLWSSWNVVSTATAFVLSPFNIRSISTIATENRWRLHKPNTLTSPTPEIISAPLSTSSTALKVWWFGGNELTDNSNNDGDSCELVAVRIERTSPNSRRIAGEISVPAPLDAVWSILTDYNRLATHVPNLMESKVVRENSAGRPGDGSYKCRLYQVGAQKIIGFDFSASVTMDMSERIIASSTNEARKIDFKCVDSQFFSEFDGAWTVKEQRNPATGEIETLCSYVVDVRPKGPVPVAALEWRIREDVPTNLRAVKAATLRMSAFVTTSKTRATSLTGSSTRSTVKADTTTNASSQQSMVKPREFPVRLTNRKAGTGSQSPGVPAPRLASVLMEWDVDETMGKYL